MCRNHLASLPGSEEQMSKIFRGNKAMVRKFLFLLALTSFSSLFLNMFLYSEVRLLKEVMGAKREAIGDNRPFVASLVDGAVKEKYPMENFEKDILRNGTSGEKFSSLLKIDFVLNVETKCLGFESTNDTIIIVIHSYPGNKPIRDAIRLTWGRRHPKYIRSIFLLGRPVDQEIQTSINQESSDNRDVVQGDFIDTEGNLTNKAMLGWKWVKEFCSTADTVIKINDNVVLDIHKIAMLYLNPYFRKENFIAGSLVEAMPIAKHPKWKWAMQADYQKSYGVNFPEYFDGNVVFMSHLLMEKLYESSLVTPSIIIEDVYWYGILPAKLQGVERFNLQKKITSSVDETIRCYIELTVDCQYIATVDEHASPETTRLIWNLISEANSSPMRESVKQQKQELHPQEGVGAVQGFREVKDLIVNPEEEMKKDNDRAGDVLNQLSQEERIIRKLQNEALAKQQNRVPNLENGNANEGVMKNGLQNLQNMQQAQRVGGQNQGLHILREDGEDGAGLNLQDEQQMQGQDRPVYLNKGGAGVRQLIRMDNAKALELMKKVKQAQKGLGENLGNPAYRNVLRGDPRQFNANGAPRQFNPDGVEPRLNQNAVLDEGNLNIAGVATRDWHDRDNEARAELEQKPMPHVQRLLNLARGNVGKQGSRGFIQPDARDWHENDNAFRAQLEQAEPLDQQKANDGNANVEQTLMERLKILRAKALQNRQRINNMV